MMPVQPLTSPPRAWTVTTFLMALAGVVPAFVGASLLLNPTAFYASYGFQLDAEPSLLSEVRGTAGMLLCASAVLVVGSAAARHRSLAAAVGSVLYLGYAGGRAVSMWMDGMPHSNVAYAAVVELALGLSCAWVYTRTTRARTTRR